MVTVLFERSMFVSVRTLDRIHRTLPFGAENQASGVRLATIHLRTTYDMQASTWPATLHAALRFVITSEITSTHKATLIEVLTQALRDHEAAELRRQASAVARGEWQEDEILELKAFLQGRVARSWQHADECVMRLAAQLHRDPGSVRDKATEFGLGAAVDYGFARMLTLGREQ